MIVNSSPKLTHDDWVKEQHEDSDIGLLIQLLKADKLKRYVAREMDSSGIQVLLKYRKGPILKEWTVIPEGDVKNSS